jgi:hypothetical protein
LDGDDFLAVAPVAAVLFEVPAVAALELPVVAALEAEAVPAVAFGATFVVGVGGLSAGAALVLAVAGTGAVVLVPLFGTASARETCPTSSANPKSQLGLAVSIPRCSHGSARRSNFQRAPARLASEGGLTHNLPASAPPAVNSSERAFQWSLAR